MANANKVSFSFTQWVKQHRRFTNAALFLLSIGITLLVCEFTFRIWISWANPQAAERVSKYRSIAGIDDSTERFKPHPYLSYTRSDTQLKENGIQIGQQFFSIKKPNDVIRVACLGGSTTMKKYPYYLQLYLDALPLKQQVEVMDFGCDGWTLVESTINYMIRVSHFDPDIVLAHHGANDGTVRLWPGFQHDYAHFRTSWKGRKASWMERMLMANSALFTYIMHREGQSAYELQNHVTRRVNPKTLLSKPNPETLHVYKNYLQKLHVLIEHSEAKMILAPVPYHPTKGRELDKQLIDECNRAMRDYAKQHNLMAADAEPLLRKHPEWFTDFAHMKDAGLYFKTQLFTQAIWAVIQQTEQKKIAPQSLARDVQISWDFEPPGTKDYHLQVKLNREKQFRYLGRTGDPKIKSFRWKTGAPNLAPELAEEFQAGPQYGTHYTFRVLAMDSKRQPKILQQKTSKTGVLVNNIGLGGD